MRSTLLDKILYTLDLDTAVVSGGVVLSVLTNRPINDIDVFCSFEEEEKINNLVALYGIPRGNADNSGDCPRPPYGDDPHAPCSFAGFSEYVTGTYLLNLLDIPLVDLTVLKVKGTDIVKVIPEIFDLDICTAMYTLDAGLISPPTFLKAIDHNEVNTIRPVNYLNTLVRMLKLCECYGISLGSSFKRLSQNMKLARGMDLLKAVQKKNLYYAYSMLTL